MPKLLQYNKWLNRFKQLSHHLGGSTTQAELNTEAFSALQAALSAAPASDNNLTSTATISAAISATVEAVKADLPDELKAD